MTVAYNEKKVKNHGIDVAREKAEQSDEDWDFGAVYVPCLADNIAEGERDACLPKGELQRGKEDFMDCASRGPNNILETKFNWLIKNEKISPSNRKWLAEHAYINKDNQIEFSDAFVAINSGTTRTGNSMKSPLDAIRKKGLIPKFVLPREDWMTFDDYQDPKRITNGMREIGDEFARRFVINYQKVYAVDYPRLIKQDMLNVAGGAWPIPVDGVYQKNDIPTNHVWMNIRDTYLAFDNYPDAVDGDFVKRLAPDFNFLEYGYRITINEEEVIPQEYNWLQRLWISIRRRFVL